MSWPLNDAPRLGFARRGLRAYDWEYVQIGNPLIT
jgi:hypothetical protein